MMGNGQRHSRSNHRQSRTDQLSAALNRLENLDRLDRLVNPIRDSVRALVQPQRLRDLLHGVPIGHPLHPVLVQVPMGSWLSVAVLDLLPGTKTASAALIATGLVGFAPSALSGWTDWSEAHEQQQRVGLVHAGSLAAGGVLMGLSLGQRLAGRTVNGKVLSYIALGAISVGGYLGGHLAYRQALGPNHAEDVPHRVEPGWQDLVAVADIPQLRPTRVLLGEVALLVFRRGDKFTALSNVCSHLSAPLDEGEVTTKPGAGSCIVCPWHGSVFALGTGQVVHGPATAPQPYFETRVFEGRLQVNLPGAG